MTVLTIVGARPQFVKAAAISRELREIHDEVLIHTGQHYDEYMSDVFFDQLDIPEPDHNLGVGSKSHGRQVAEMLINIERLIEEYEPKTVLLYGDTNSTLAGAIAGAKAETDVAHVEAGLRSYNWSMPEEINRVLTDHAADLLLAPSENAVENLRAEGLTEGVHNAGDVMYDAILWAREVAARESTVLEDLGICDDEYILTTIHRASNTDNFDHLERIVDALADAPLPVVFPVHPRTKDRLKEARLWKRTESELRLIDPVGYLDFVRLLDDAERVATDSGGVQKEAFYLDTFCVTLREETEWVETVDTGWNVLVGTDSDAIEIALSQTPDPDIPKPAPYGDGNAARAIVNHLQKPGR